MNKDVLSKLCILLFVFSTSAFAEQQTQTARHNPPARITRDAFGVPHIVASNDRDLFYAQGWVHAQDRLFQMDLLRRNTDGTLAELFGQPTLADDVEIRRLGMRRAAQLSFELLSPSVRQALKSYSDGVNAYIASHALPPEYAVLEISQVRRWDPIESLLIVKLIALDLSFDIDVGLTQILGSYQLVGRALGFDGTALFSQDLVRSAPFKPASTIPDSRRQPFTFTAGSPFAWQERALASSSTSPAQSELSADALALAGALVERMRDVSVLRDAMQPLRRQKGSNEWVVSGRHTPRRLPLLANDPHLVLDTPSTFYQNHLRTGSIEVSGASFAGVPFVVLGHNRHITWGATTNPMDVTDTFLESVVSDPASPSGFSITHRGQLEPILVREEAFRVNNVGDGVVDNLTAAPNVKVYVVPRRNFGPILQPVELAPGPALSVQYTGFGATRELEAFATWNRARGLDDFRRGLTFFDFGSQNFSYSDVRGNIAFFSSGKLPLREDLQAGTVAGAAPFFVRNGTAGNEWLRARSTPQHCRNPRLPRAVECLYEVLPANEMPLSINPPAGFLVSANNDPAGTTLDNDPLNQLRPGGGIFYLNVAYDIGLRGGRVTEMIVNALSRGERISFEDMQQMQADTVLGDAEVFTPLIVRAYRNATSGNAHPALAALGADARVAEAVGRLSQWDFTSPTGIEQGYDASDVNGKLSPPSQQEISASVAATLYSVWRGQIVRNTIDAVLDPFGLPRPPTGRELIALRQLLDRDDFTGVGASGVNFFNVPGVADAHTRRDILLLNSLADALNALASERFATAFGLSTRQDDYRWGRLHRIVFDHPLGEPFSAPPAGGAFPPPLANLRGIPTDGGFDTVDTADHAVRADNENAFMFGGGPVHRFVSEMAPGRVRAETSLPGGESGVLGNRFYINLLGRWLTNDTFPLTLR